MAAIIEPRRQPFVSQQRPALRLVGSDGSTSVTVPVDLGITPTHLVAVAVAFLVVVLLTIAIGSGALAGLSPAPGGASQGSPSASAPGAAAGSQTVTVEAGDTLWSIARRIQPTGDVRPLVDQLIAANGGGPLQPGDRIVVPA